MTEEQFEQCVQKIKSGDKDGLKTIYLGYIAFIYSVINEVLQNKENAEDVTSEFFIKLWDVADHYRPGGGHRTWMATIARNMAIDYIRKHKRETLVDEFPDVSQSMTNHHTSTIEEEVVSDMSIQDALDQLKDGERQIVNMKVLGDMTFKDIAEVLRIPMGTVTWKYQNAIKKLRRCGYE